MPKPTVRDLCDPAFTPPDPPRRTPPRGEEEIREVAAMIEDAMLGALCQNADLLKRVPKRFHASDVARVAAEAARSYLRRLP